MEYDTLRIIVLSKKIKERYVGIIINFTLLLHALCLIFSIYFDCYSRVFFNLLFCCIGIIIE